MKDITPDDVRVLTAAWSALRDVYNKRLSKGLIILDKSEAKALSDAFQALEDIRPGGGFKQLLNPIYCKECGAIKDAKLKEKRTDSRS